MTRSKEFDKDDAIFFIYKALVNGGDTNYPLTQEYRLIEESKGVYNVLEITPTRECSIVTTDELVNRVISASANLAELYGPRSLCSRKDAIKAIGLFVSYISMFQPERILNRYPDFIGFADEPEKLCFKRLQYRIKTEFPDETGRAFWESVKRRMVDYDKATDTSQMFEKIKVATWKLLFERGVSEQYIYWHGPGGDGKSTYMRFLSELTGHGSITVPATFVDGAHASQMLVGRRFVHITEANPSFCLSSKFKSWTGEDFLPVNEKYGRQYNAQNNCFFWLTSNELPYMQDTHADLRRAVIIESDRAQSADLDKDYINQVLCIGAEWFLHECKRAYEACGGKIAVTTREDLEDLIDQSEAPDLFLFDKYFEYAPGFFLTNSEAEAVFLQAKMSNRTAKARFWQTLTKKAKREGWDPLPERGESSVYSKEAKRKISVRGMRHVRLRQIEPNVVHHLALV